MATKQKMQKCKTCGKKTLHIQQTPNHILHLLLTVVTGGLWAIAWIIISLSSKNPQCTVCGSDNKSFRVV